MQQTEEDVWTERLIRHAHSGTPLDLAPDVPDEELALERTDAWLHERTIPANAIRRALLSKQLSPDPRGLTIRAARITGTLDIDYAAIPCRLAILASLIEGKFSAEHAQFRALDLTGCHTRRVNIDSAHFNGDCNLSDIRSTGGVYATSTSIGGHLALTDAELINPGGDALTLDNARIDGTVLLTRVRATGEVRAPGAHIGGQLILNNARLENSNGSALTIESVQIDKDAVLANLRAVGGVRAISAHIGGQLVLNDGELVNPNGNALLLDRGQVDGNVFFERLRTTGEVRLAGAHIGGQLILSDAELSNPNRVALFLDSIWIGNAAFLNNLRATGEITATEANITYFDLTEAEIANPQGHAIVLDRAQIKSSAVFINLQATGEVRAAGAQIGGQLDLTDATLVNPGERALTLRSTILNEVVMDGLTTDGSIDLRAASIANLVTVGGFANLDERKTSLPGPLLASAWKIKDVQGLLRHDRRAAERWLDSASEAVAGFIPQPWHELAAVYERNGQASDGRRLRAAAAHRSARSSPWYSRPIRWLYGFLVGYGYYPLLAAVWLIVAALATFALTSFYPNSFLPTDFSAATPLTTTASPPNPTTISGTSACEDIAPDYPCFRPSLYALEVMLPVADLGQVEAWSPLTSNWLPHALIVLRATVWIMTVLLLAGVTGLLRKT